MLFCEHTELLCTLNTEPNAVFFLCDTPVLFTFGLPRLAPLPSSRFFRSASPFLFLHTNHACDCTLLQPRPSILLSTHQSLSLPLTTLAPATVSQADRRDAAISSKTSCIFLSLPPAFYLCFVVCFFKAMRQIKKIIKKRRHCTGWGEGTERLVMFPWREARYWLSRQSFSARRRLIGEESRVAMNMDEGLMKGWLEGAPASETVLEQYRCSHTHADRTRRERILMLASTSAWFSAQTHTANLIGSSSAFVQTEIL